MGFDVYTVLTVLLSGGVGSIITKIYDHWMAKRQEKRDMARVRLETISRAAPYYSRLGLYNCWTLAWLLEAENLDHELMFYHLCNILNLRHNIIQTFGEIQLDNLEAEDVIGDIARNIIRMVENGFGHVDASRMQYMVENDLPFHKFHEILQGDENRALYQRFVDWIGHQEVRTELVRNCRWFAELIMLELNHLYEPWYGEPPILDRLDEGLRTYLMNDHVNYNNRIHDFRKGFFRAKHSVTAESRANRW